MNKSDQLFDFDDILIIPKKKSTINSRYTDVFLPKKIPLFTAPMDTVVDLSNVDKFKSISAICYYLFLFILKIEECPRQ
jgi:hypothetical protein